MKTYTTHPIWRQSSFECVLSSDIRLTPTATPQAEPQLLQLKKTGSTKYYTHTHLPVALVHKQQPEMVFFLKMAVFIAQRWRRNVHSQDLAKYGKKIEALKQVLTCRHMLAVVPWKVLEHLVQAHTGTTTTHRCGGVVTSLTPKVHQARGHGVQLFFFFTGLIFRWLFITSNSLMEWIKCVHSAREQSREVMKYNIQPLVG